MTTPRRPARLWADTDERLRRTTWPRRHPSVPTPGTDAPRVAVITVNYNTGELVARLVFSLTRVLAPGAVDRIVVVDNGSTDGSPALLEALAGAGIIELVVNGRRPYHGPGLNRGMSHLARGQRAGDAPVDLVWVLDSDVMVLTPDVLDSAVAHLRRRGAAVLGQEQPYDQPRPHLERYVHPSAMLVDPAQVWRHSVPAFLEDGAPAVMQQYVLRRRGRPVVDHRWYDDLGLVHLGGGTLDALVRDGATGNRYFTWAQEGHGRHFHGVAAAEARFHAFDACFRADVGPLTADSLVRACSRPERVGF